MSLFEQILNSAVGGAAKQASPSSNNPLTQILSSLGSGNQQAQSSNALASILKMVQQQGGLIDVLGKFAQGGLKKEADSWVSTGPNLPVSGQQIQKALGEGPLKNISSQLGVSQRDAGSLVAKILPELINQLTPKGQVPANHADLFSQGLQLLSKLQK